ncbi:MAG: class I tRNA ligase family protein [Patescibacteria group bacterium]
MADKEQPQKPAVMPEKSALVQREEELLAFWQANNIFEKTLEKDSPQGNYMFFDGPPFATGAPHYGHILPGTMKDVIPRYKTMNGFHVPRRWGWDTHGLPIENLVEKELGLKSKKDIEELGIEKFNDKARESVLRYDHEWKAIIPRTGRFIDMENAYKTMDWKYSESIWWSFKTLHDKNLIYQGFKSMSLCPHCETTLSNFEVTQGYKDITDISVYAKFELVDEPGTFVVAWTTTPWTLPGNAALAVKPDVTYVKVKDTDPESNSKTHYIFAKDLLEKSKDKFKSKNPEIVSEFLGADLLGKTYKPVFDYYVNADLKNKENAWKIVGGEFVTTTDGTGVVHIAPAFGEDDYLLSVKENLPFIQHVNTDGTFKKEVTDFAGTKVKAKATKEDPIAHQKADIEVIKYLAGKGTLFAKEKLIHSYPHCWRCDTPLLNYASSSWFVKVTEFKDKLVEENKKVTWVPPEIGENRFGKWLENARDWAISRSRYWGAPLPVWICKECGKTEVMGSLSDLKKKTKRNTYFVMRHGEADHNVANILSCDPKFPHHLTDHGREQAQLSAEALKDKNIDIIIASPCVRTQETADVVTETIAFKGERLSDDRIQEFNFGDYNGKTVEEYHRYFGSVKERLTKSLPGGENLTDVRARIGDFIYDIDAKYEGKNILLVTHDGPATMLFAVAEGGHDEKIIELWGMDRNFLTPGQESPLDFAQLPHNRAYQIDLHRPFIDEVAFACDCGGTFKRVPEVFDTWYESGSMPYGQLHYPFENKELIDSGKRFPADFIAEGQDQTRGWFYSLLVLSVALFGKAPYKNVIVNGIVLAEDGQKMSKRLKNYPEVSYIFDKYGADAMRYYLLASPAVRAEDLAFTEKGVDEISKKVLMRLQNVYSFFATYERDYTGTGNSTTNVLDQWILARLNEVSQEVTTNLESYKLDRAARPFMQFVDDLSTWYLRRSRDRFKGDDAQDKENALYTTQYVLRELSKLVAPFMPFLAEDIYQKVKGTDGKESVHLESWPGSNVINQNVIVQMQEVRNLVSTALEVRSKAGVKVRQPLSKLTIAEKSLVDNQQFKQIIADELNVKEVIFGDELNLDTTITPELKEEGLARDFMRALQEARKNAGLNPHDFVTLTVDTSDTGKSIIEKFKSDIMKVAQVRDVVFSEVEGEELKIEDLTFKLSLQK